MGRIMTTFEDGTGSGPKSAQNIRRKKVEPGPVVPRACLGCAHCCNCGRIVPRGTRFPDCFKAPKEAMK